MLRKGAKLFGIVLLVLMARVWIHVQAQRLDRQVKSLRLEADRLMYENGRLQVQVHQHVSPANLEWLAKSNYAMGPLEPKRRIGLQP